MYGASAPGCLHKIALQLHLAQVEGGDQERLGDAIQGGVEAAGLLEIADNCLDTGTSKGSGPLSTSHQRPHWHTTRRQLPDRGTPNETSSPDNENHTTSPDVLASVSL